ncbi:hypothetical protein [Paraburkholderia caribensis]|uniref:hypothetical protein n=1 Tax=Paraburkholderia caribensis TaxID=75105 RepID=UPI0034D30A0A
MKKNETTELTVVERAALALGTSEREAKLAELVKQSATIVEIKNNAARDQAHGAAMVLRTTRVEIEKAGKAAREDATAFSKAVIAEEKRLLAITQPEETRLLELRDAWDERIAAEKRAKVEAEARRIATIRDRIDGIRSWVPTMASQSSTALDDAIKTMVAMPIDVEHFAEMTGDAEMARGETLEKLRAMQAAAVDRETEARRVAEEAARLAAERSAFEEEQRRAAAARAEQERKDAEARAAREVEERKQREAEEAARREQQAREDAERRAKLEAEEQRLAAERAEMARRQAELDRAEQEAREREEAALREAAELSARAEADRKERERAENLAARNAPQPTGGTWSIGKMGGCIVSTEPIAGCPGSGHNDVEYYGGHLICESVWRPADAHVLAASRDMFTVLTLMVEQITHPANAEHTLGAFSLGARIAEARAALAKATYVPEVQPEAAAA